MPDTEIQISDRTARDAFEPANFTQAAGLAQSLAKSGLMPRALATPEAILTAIVMGRELGLSAMKSIRSIHVIEGKPSLSSALIVALVKRETSLCSYFQMIESTDEIATYETQRVGEPKPTRMSFTIAQANKAGVTGKDNWKKFPAAMLRARCETALARVVYPDLVMGLYEADETESAPRDITPPRVARVVGDAPIIPPAAEAVEDAVIVEPAVNPETGEVALTPATAALLERFAKADTRAEVGRISAEVTAGKESKLIPESEWPALRAAFVDAKAKNGGAK